MAELGVKDTRWNTPTKGISHPLPEGYKVVRDPRFNEKRTMGRSVAAPQPAPTATATKPPVIDPPPPAVAATATTQRTKGGKAT